MRFGRQSQEAEAEPAEPAYRIRSVERVERGAEHALALRRLSAGMKEYGEPAREKLDHWLRANLRERRAILESEPDRRKRIDRYALDFAQMLEQAMFNSGKAVSAESTVSVPGFSFDADIVREAATLVHDYYRQQGFSVHYSAVLSREPLELPDEDPLFYTVHQLHVSGWEPTAKDGDTAA